jgi:hypothetical protein
MLHFYLFRLGKIGNVFSSFREDELVKTCLFSCSIQLCAYKYFNDMVRVMVVITFCN